MCECEFSEEMKDPSDDESWHYKRTCVYCGFVWAGLHCPHDGYQNPCPKCERRPETVPDPEDPRAPKPGGEGTNGR